MDFCGLLFIQKVRHHKIQTPNTPTCINEKGLETINIKKLNQEIKIKHKLIKLIKKIISKIN